MPSTDPSGREAVETAPSLCPRGSRVAVCAIALRHWLTPFLGDDNPYHTGLGGGRVRGLVLAGAGPSIAATFVSLFGVKLLAAAFVEVWCLGPSELPSGVMFGFLVLYSAMIIALGEGYGGVPRRSRERTEEGPGGAERSPVAPCPPGPHARGGNRNRHRFAEQARLIDLAKRRHFCCELRTRRSRIGTKAPKGSTVGPPPKPSVRPPA